MNYRIQLIHGEGADFFLEEWRFGGVKITPAMVGLFEAARHKDELDESLDVFQLDRVTFDLMSLLKVGLSPEWLFTGIHWSKERESASLATIQAKLHGVLGTGLIEDQARQLHLLKLVKAAVKREGTPAWIEGRYESGSGRSDRVLLFASGVVTYDRTPHPQPLLEKVAAVVGAL